MNFIKNGVRHTQQTLLGTCLLAALLALSSCGGSSSTTMPQKNLPSPVADSIKGETLVPAANGQDPAQPAELAALPTIALNQRQFADPNVLLNLKATVTAAAGATIVTTLWTQVTGPAVRIPSPLQLNNDIVIPDVAVATTLEFRLTAQDSKGKVNSATVSILVKPVPYFVKVIGGVFNEVDKVALFTLRLNAASALPVTFSYITQDGSANHGSDYSLTSGQITFAAGELSKTISVPLMDDALSEDDETFSLQVTAMDGDAAHSNSGIAIIHSGTEALLPQTILFGTAAPANIKVNTQYTNPLDAGPGTGAVLYTSSNPQIATVDGNGKVTALTAGTVTITAIKSADSIYAATEASYLILISPGSAPFVSIFTHPFYQHTRVTKTGVPFSLYGFTSPAISDPNTHSWSSNLDGFLGSGQVLHRDSLTQGLHILTETLSYAEGTTQASTLVTAGNLAPSAIIADALPSSCEYLKFYDMPQMIADLDFGTYDIDENCDPGVYTSFTWPSAVTIDNIDLYLRTDLPIATYTIEYLDKNTSTWIPVPLTASGSLGGIDPEDNRTLELQHYAVNAINTDQVRIWQPQYGRINEILILGRGPVSNAPTNADIDPIAIQVGQQLELTGTAFDREDGQLPATNQTPPPLWSSNTLGTLGSGTTLKTSSLPQGLHIITFSASDSDGNSRSATVPVLVGNIAPLAYAQTGSEKCWDSTCYRSANINDGNLGTDPGIYSSWMNMGLDALQPGDFEWASLSWNSDVTVNGVDLYFTEGKALQAYDIEYMDENENWIKLAGVTDNSSAYKSHTFTPAVTSWLRVKIIKGSAAEPNFARINEMVVFGTQVAVSSASSSSSASSYASNSSIGYNNSNLALLAVAEDVTTTTPCSSNSLKINDGNLNTSFVLGCGSIESLTTLRWDLPVTITGVEIYTDEADPMPDFYVNIGNDGYPSWANPDVRKIYAVADISTTALTLYSRSHGSIKEIIVHGHLTENSSATSSSSVASSSSAASSSSSPTSSASTSSSSFPP